MTIEPKEEPLGAAKAGPLGRARSITSLDEIKITHLDSVDQIIGLGINIKGTDIEIIGKRWPGNGEFYKEEDPERPTPAKLAKHIKAMQNPGADEDYMFKISQDLLTVQVQGKTLLFLTSNIENFGFVGDVLVRSTGKEQEFDKCEFQIGSVKYFPSKRTVLWLSKLEKDSKEDTTINKYDIEAELRQDRNGQNLALPIIIDPGTQNGGVGGWP